MCIGFIRWVGWVRVLCPLIYLLNPKLLHWYETVHSNTLQKMFMALSLMSVLGTEYMPNRDRLNEAWEGVQHPSATFRSHTADTDTC